MERHGWTKNVLLGAFLCILAVPSTGHGDPVKDHEIALTKGQYEIELGNYDAAIGHLKDATGIKPTDIVTMVALGIAYSRAERYEEAREVLQRAVDADPANARGRYELGVVLAHLKQYGEANRLLATVSALTADEELSDRSKELMEGMQPREKGTRPSLTITAGGQYDSNVILEPDHPLAPRGSKGDWRGVLSLTGAVPFLQSEGRGAEARYQLYQSMHLHLEDYNVQLHDLSIGGKYQFAGNIQATAQYGYVASYVGGEHYSGLHRLRLGLRTALTSSSQTSLHFGAEDRRYFNSSEFPTNADRSGTTFTAGAAHAVQFTRQTGVTVEYGYQRDNADTASWDVTGHKGAVFGRSRLGKYTVFCTLAASDWKYGPSPVPFYPSRHDRRWDVTAGVYRDLSRTVRVSLANQHVWNDSNLDTYLYERNIVGLLAEVRL